MYRFFIYFSFIAFACNQEFHETQLITDEIKQVVKERVEQGIYPAVVIGMIDPYHREFYCYGINSFISKLPVSEKTIFEIGSVTKTFTGVLLADMIVKGEVKANDRLQNYLPANVHSPAFDRKHIRLINLANHSSSLPRNPLNWPPPYTGNYKTKLLYEFLNGYILDYKIGERFEYSNLGIGLLGHVLALKQKETYEHLLNERIFLPLNLHSTRINLSDSMYFYLARGHNKFLNETVNMELLSLEATGGLRSNASDLLHYVAANMGLEKSELYPAMQLSHQVTFSETDSQKVGMAWLRYIHNDIDIIWHNGSTFGYSAYIGFTADNKRGVVILTNSENPVNDLGRHLLKPELSLEMVKVSIGKVLNQLIKNGDINSLKIVYDRLFREEANTYNFGEGELNALGNELLSVKNYQAAIEIYKLNVSTYPESYKAFDSLADAYLKNNQKNEAIRFYQKSLDLNPENQTARKMINMMTGE